MLYALIDLDKKGMKIKVLDKKSVVLLRFGRNVEVWNEQ